MKIIATTTGILALFFSFSLSADDARKPNVVFILADDLGWADTTLYGHTKLYETPNIQKLADRGMLFKRSYSTPLCSPTRATILTGQNSTRHGSTAPTHHKPGPNALKAMPREDSAPDRKSTTVVSANRLDNALPTLGKRFKDAGYHTAHFGKWHLGEPPFSPLEHGFDIDIPHHNGPAPAGNFVAPWRYKNFKENHPNEHIEDRMAEEAVKWMKSLPKDEPFFLNFWQFSVHAPFDAKKDYIDSYRGKIDPKSAQRSPTYAAMVKSMDDAVGTLVNAVEEAGITENTIFIFTSDNGGNMYNGITETTADGSTYLTEPTSNRPLRGGKATVFEGGIRVPTTIVWPGLAKAGSSSDELIHCYDFYPTLCSALGFGIPAGHPVDGIDITPAIRGGKLDRKAIFTYFPHNPGVPDWLPSSISVHSGDWKLIRLFYDGENGAHSYHLYNLAEDIGETKNMADKNPDKVRELDALIEAHLSETKAVLPIANPKFDPAKYDPASIGVQRGGLNFGKTNPEYIEKKKQQELKKKARIQKQKQQQKKASKPSPESKDK